jgi:hypothetical protein
MMVWNFTVPLNRHTPLLLQCRFWSHDWEAAMMERWVFSPSLQFSPLLLLSLFSSAHNAPLRGISFCDRSRVSSFYLSFFLEAQFLYHDRLMNIVVNACSKAEK